MPGSGGFPGGGSFTPPSGDGGSFTPPSGNGGTGATLSASGGMPDFSGGGMPSGFPGQTSSGYDLSTWLWVGGCAILLLAGILFAALYKRH